MNDLAPVAVFCYERLDHLKETIKKLEQCTLAKDTELFVISDGAKKNNNKEVSEVRSFSHTIKGFKKVTIWESEVNNGLSNAIVMGVSEILKSFDRVIVLEDDLQVSKDFLLYINNALDYYKEDSKVFSICGYKLPFKNKELFKPLNGVHAVPRFGCWGWGIWKDRFDKVEWNITNINELLGDKKQIKQLTRAGEDLLWSLKDEVVGFKSSTWSYRMNYALHKSNSYTIYPNVSKVRNIGSDGTGVHKDKTDKFDVFLDETTEICDYTYSSNQAIDKLYYRYATSYKRWLANKLGLESIIKPLWFSVLKPILKMK